jgi:hypothetical protein
MNQNDANRTVYDAPQEEEILRAIQNPARRAELIRFLEERGLLGGPSGLRA